MVRPVRFGFNEQTAESNAFQQQPGRLRPEEIQENAQREFDTFVDQLREAGIEVTVVEDTPEPHTPDSIFPNNWVSFHADGKVVLYPMQAPNRRSERRQDIVDQFLARYTGGRLLDFSGYESQGLFLEGTGSMILDRVNGVVYACLSPRTSAQLLQEYGARMGYRVVAFHASDARNQAIYHTNVMMALGASVAVLCVDAVRDAAERQALMASLAASGHEVVAITFDQMNAFAGNMLELLDGDGQRRMVMSARAYHSLTPAQIEAISRHARPIVVPLDVVETYGGGSVRCMLAEVF
ncbi:MAG: amidinotransferase [Bacteroidetes bacterium]|nr:MAG: amidinotransferase [Bacteroidota bacterium]